jgi:hypothetical protein
MPRQRSRPSTHDCQRVQDTVAEAIERDLTRVQARLMAVACDTIAAGGSHVEMARLTGCRGGHLPARLLLQAFPLRKGFLPGFAFFSRRSAWSPAPVLRMNSPAAQVILPLRSEGLFVLWWISRLVN